MREQRIIMGMPVQLEIVDEAATAADYETVFDYLRAVDEQFSPYKETSEVSKINRGEIEAAAYSAEMQEVCALAEETRTETNGYFNSTTPEGVFDPSGLVKGWAIQNAADKLLAAGFKNFYLEVAGDIQTAGHNAAGNEWSIGIRNPFAREEIVQIVYPHGNGIATSGTYIRGAHLYDPVVGGPVASPYVSLTVIGPNVYEADRFATAAFAMAESGLSFIETLPGFEAYAIDTKRNASMTSGFLNFTTL